MASVKDLERQMARIKAKSSRLEARTLAIHKKVMEAGQAGDASQLMLLQKKNDELGREAIALREDAERIRSQIESLRGHGEFWAGRHGKPPQPSPYSILKGVTPVTRQHKGFELFAVQQARTGTWFAKALGYDEDYIGVGPDAEEALARAALYLDEDIPPRGRMNPGKSSHAAKAKRALTASGASLHESLKSGPGFDAMFNHALDAIKYAGHAYSEAEGAAEDRLIRGAREAGNAAIHRAKMLVKVHTRRLNPADIPGGNMTACIAIMEARGDVDSPGALCNWLARKSGEPRGGIRRPKRPVKREQRHLLSRAMRGT